MQIIDIQTLKPFTMKSTKLIQLFIAVFIIFSDIPFTQAQTAGSIAFMGLQTTPNSVFAIIVIDPISPGTTIRFTDNAWDGNNLLNNESVMSWTSPGNTLNTGSIIRFTDNGSANAQVTGGGSASGKLANLSSGDQILAFTGNVDSPSFIAAISTKNFLSECSSEVGDTATCLPAPLVIGQNAIAFTQSDDVFFNNGFFSSTNFIGTAVEMRLAVCNVNYWIRNDDAQLAGVSAWPNWNFTVGTPFPSVVRFSQNAVTIIEGQGPVNIQLQLDFPQPIPQIVRLNVLNFGSTTASDYVTNPPVVNNVLEINVAPNQTNISFSIEALLDGVPEPDEVVSFTLANLTSGLSIGSPATCAVTIQNVDINFSQISFASDNYSITEGDTPIDIVININPPAPSAQTIGISISNGIGVDATDYFLTPAPIGNLLSLNVPENASSVSFRFTVLNDQEAENDETVQFILAELGPVFQAVSPSICLVTIIDNDTPIINIPELLINELMPLNVNSIADAFGQFDPWVEIYNTSNQSTSLSNLYLSDVPSNPTKYRFPVVGSSVLDIAANGYKVVWADATTSQGPLHTNFTLNPNGGFLSLYAEDGSTLIDSISYPSIPSGRSYGRENDGANNWIIFNSPTPGAENRDSIPTQLSVINDFDIQVYPNPASDVVFVKINGNFSSNQLQFSIVDLGGKQLLRKRINNFDAAAPFASFSLKGLEAGIYFLSMESNQQTITKRFVKQ